MMELWSYPFMRDALWAGWAVATVCSVLSCYIVLKGWSLMGDAVSHAVLPGVVGAYMLGLPLPLGAFATGVTCALATGWLRQRSPIKEDAALGILFTGLFALGLVLHSRVESGLHLDHILFGNILGIEEEPMRWIFIIGGLVLAVVLGLRRELLMVCFDAPHARSLGFPVGALSLVLLGLLAAACVVAIQAVGVILVVAMLITPGCVGYLMSERFGGMMAWSVGSAWVSTAVGIYLSFVGDVATAPCIVLVQSFWFLGAFFFAPKHGWWAVRRRFAASD
jgi:ABC-type Mn2+/Zn2+ transport system permease subunit